MKAVVQVGYGSADVLEFKEIDRPVAADDERAGARPRGIACRR